MTTHANCPYCEGYPLVDGKCPECGEYTPDDVPKWEETCATWARLRERIRKMFLRKDQG